MEPAKSVSATFGKVCLFRLRTPDSIRVNLFYRYYFVLGASTSKSASTISSSLIKKRPLLEAVPIEAKKPNLDMADDSKQENGTSSTATNGV